MSWSWLLEAADGPEGAGGADLDLPASPTHGSQSDAESWLGENWRELAEQRVAQVSLLHDGEVVYGPMSLEPADG